MTKESHPYVVVILDAEGEEVHVGSRDVCTPVSGDEVGATVAFPTQTKAQQFYDTCKAEFPDCSIKILPR